MLIDYLYIIDGIVCSNGVSQRGHFERVQETRNYTQRSNYTMAQNDLNCKFACNYLTINYHVSPAYYLRSLINHHN